MKKIISILAILFSVTTAFSQAGAVKTVNTIAQLKLLNPDDKDRAVLVADSSGLIYVWNKTSTATADDDDVVQSSRRSTGRWLKFISGGGGGGTAYNFGNQFTTLSATNVQLSASLLTTNAQRLDKTIHLGSGTNFVIDPLYRSYTAVATNNFWFAFGTNSLTSTNESLTIYVDVKDDTGFKLHTNGLSGVFAWGFGTNKVGTNTYILTRSGGVWFYDQNTAQIDSALLADGSISADELKLLDGKTSLQEGPLTGDVTTSGAAATIANSAVTLAKMESRTASTLLGRGSSGSGAPQEITVGSGLSLSGTTLSVSGGAVDINTYTTSTNAWTNLIYSLDLGTNVSALVKVSGLGMGPTNGVFLHDWAIGWRRDGTNTPVTWDSTYSRTNRGGATLYWAAVDTNTIGLYATATTNENWNWNIEGSYQAVTNGTAYAGGGGSCSTTRDGYTGATSSSIAMGDVGAGSHNYISIKFTAGANYDVCKVVARLSKQGSYSANVQARIYTDSGGSPGSGLGSGWSDAVATSSIGGSEQDVTFANMTGTLASGTTYHLVLNVSASGDGSNYLLWYYEFDAGLGVAKSSSSGSGWSTESSNTKLKFISYSN